MAIRGGARAGRGKDCWYHDHTREDRFFVLFVSFSLDFNIVKTGTVRVRLGLEYQATKSSQ